jgi:LPXTG-site transpeptidase (sortase) family protein
VVRLLAALGPVETLSGETVNAETGLAFAAEQIYQQESGGEINPQTQLLQEMGLTFAILTRDLSTAQVLQLTRFLQEAAPRKDFLMTSFDPPLAYSLNQMGLDGALQGQQDDYFYLVESNISVNKSSQFIRQNLNYEVTLSPDGWPGRAKLTVEESNLFRPEDKIPGFPENVFNGLVWPFPPKREERLRPEGYYGGYTRLFPPPGSEFKAVIGFDDGPYIMEESHRPMASGYMGLYAGEQQQLQFEWVPAGQPSEAGRYRLLAQRQPGAPEHALTVVTNLPPGYQATDISPAPISASAGKITWQAVLDRDQLFSLRLVDETDAASDTSAPTTSPAAPEAIAPPATPVTATIASAPDSPRPVAPASTPEPFRAPLPVYLSIPAIGVGAPVVPVGLEPSGIMASPAEADLAGWYELGPRPGEPSNAVIAAHVDWLGQEGAFARLNELQPGDTIEVLNGPESGFKFVVESIDTYQADSAPVADIFGPTPTRPTLTLITCDGPYDYRRQEYRDRLVVRARGIN